MGGIYFILMFLILLVVPWMVMLMTYSLLRKVATVIYMEKESLMTDTVQIYGIPKSAYWLSYVWFFLLVKLVFGLPTAVLWQFFPAVFRAFMPDVLPGTATRADVNVGRRNSEVLGGVDV